MGVLVPGRRTSLAWPTVAMILSMAFVDVSGAAEFTCAAGDVPCLATAIQVANANGESNVIQLAVGTYSLSQVDNETPVVGANGLPAVSGSLVVRGAGSRA